jgi:hypothetical protein
MLLLTLASMLCGAWRARCDEDAATCVMRHMGQGECLPRVGTESFADSLSSTVPQVVCPSTVVHC